MSEKLDLVRKIDSGLLRLTNEGREAIAPQVTSVDDSVYAFTPEADAVTIAAGMARLSRNPNDLRTIIAGEFTGNDNDEAVLQRVVAQYGDDSVKQLLPVAMAFEGISNIATKEIEWGRLAAYLEQSTRYLRFDRRDEDNQYGYFTPEDIGGNTELYKTNMDAIFDIYSELYSEMLVHLRTTSAIPDSEQDAAWRQATHAAACDAIRGVLPASTKATVGVVGSAQAIENMILHLEGHPLKEMRDLGSRALVAVRSIAPVFFERTDNPTQGGLISAHTSTTQELSRELANELLADLPEVDFGGPRVLLTGEYGSEDELIAKILFDNSNKPMTTIRAAVVSLSDEDKQRVITTYVGQRYNRRAKPGRAFELPHYNFEVQCDYAAFRDIQRHRMVDGLEWQPLNPNIGYEVPQAVIDAGLEDKYRSAFTISEQLYNRLVQDGYADQAQYATLFGHIMRFDVTFNARSMTHTAELRTTPHGHPNYRRVFQQMHEQIAEVHPNIAAAMIFVSQAEDEELARLGAERNRAEKLARAGMDYTKQMIDTE